MPRQPTLPLPFVDWRGLTLRDGVDTQADTADLLGRQAGRRPGPARVLEWKTPAEALDEQLRSLQQPGGATID